MSNYWTDYWQRGHLTSFGDDLKANYTGSLFSQWKTFFETYQDAQVSIVDIGTGNGALIDIAVNAANCSAPMFYGVDFAELKVSAELDKPNVVFKSNTFAEALPFKSDTVDVVVSQFGIEYSDMEKSVAEVARVLKPAGKIRWLMHDSNSSIVKPNSQILEAITGLEQDGGPLTVLRQLINSLAKFGPQSAQAENCRAALNNAIQTLAAQNQQGLYGTNFPAFLKAVMKPSVKFKDRKQMLKLFEKEMKGQWRRLDDLMTASLTPVKKDTLLEVLETKSIVDVSVSEVSMDGKVIGTLITGAKSGR